MKPGEVVKHYRERKGLSQFQLAVAVGRTAAAVTQWERGVNRPRQPMVQAIDSELGAGGAILSAYGYVTQSDFATADQLAALQAQVDRLQAMVEEAAKLGATGAVAARRPGPKRRGSAGSS